MSIKKNISNKKELQETNSVWKSLVRVIFVFLKIFGILIIITNILGIMFLSFIGSLSGDSFGSGNAYVYILIGLIMIFSENIIKIFKRKKSS
jgi:hypothetical protein